MLNRAAFAAALSFTVALTGCGEDEEEELAAAGAEPGEYDEDYEEYDAPPPEHEGTVMMAGDYPVELVPHEDGEVHAYLLGDDEVDPEQVTLTVEVPVAEGEPPQPMPLVYSPANHRWEGRVADTTFQPGPFEVVVEVDGEPYFGHAPQVVVARPVVVVAGRPRAPVVEIYPPSHPRYRVVHRPGFVRDHGSRGRRDHRSGRRGRVVRPGRGRVVRRGRAPRRVGRRGGGRRRAGRGGRRGRR